MIFIRIIGLAALIAQSGIGQSVPETFDLKVERVRTLRDQPGDLHIDAQVVTFRSRDGKTTINIPINDLREADVADPRVLRFQAYEVQKWKPIERREYTFRAGSEAPVEQMAQFLTVRVWPKNSNVLKAKKV